MELPNWFTSNQILIDIFVALLTVALTALGLLYNRMQARAKEWERLEKITETVRTNFPFDAVTVDELPSKFPNLPRADQELIYMARLAPDEQKKMLEDFEQHHRLLIRGRTGLGKTREAIEIVKRLADNTKEPITILLPQKSLSSPPFVWPTELASRHIVLFFDDVQWHYLQDSGSRGSRELSMATGDYQTWLPETVQWFSGQFKGSDLRVVATLRDDPIELWERIDPNSEFWKTFHVVRLADWQIAQSRELVRQTAKWQNVANVDDQAENILLQRSDRTPASMILFMKKNHDVANISIAEAQTFDGRYPYGWESVWNEDIAPHHASRYLFISMSLLYQTNIVPFRFLAIRLAARLWNGFLPVRHEWYVRGALHHVESWIREEEGLLKCAEAYLEGRASLREHVSLLMDLILHEAADPLRASKLASSLFGFGYALEWDLRDHNSAIIILTRASQLLSKESKVYYHLGVALVRGKRSLEALAAFEKAIALDPNYTFAYNGKGNALSDLKKPDEALAAFEKAIALDPNDAVYYNGKGNALSDLKKPDEALAAFEKAIALDPNDAIYYRNRASLNIELGNLEKAGLDIQTAQQLQPAHPFLFGRYGQLYLELNKFQDSIAASRKGMEKAPDESWMQFNLALAEFCLGNLAVAVAEYKKGLQLAKDAEELSEALKDFEKKIVQVSRLKGSDEIRTILQNAIAERTNDNDSGQEV